MRNILGHSKIRAEIATLISEMDGGTIIPKFFFNKAFEVISDWDKWREKQTRTSNLTLVCKYR